MAADLIIRAKDGDGGAFRELVTPLSPQLRAHCYRLLGSVHDAEEAMQEALVAAWRNFDSLGELTALEAWLYRIATNCCLDILRSRRRRGAISSAFLRDLPETRYIFEASHLEPDADPPVATGDPGPSVRYETRESVSLAFLTLLQSLPPRQRVALVLRDVVGFSAEEVADILDSTLHSVTSALKRARASLKRAAVPIPVPSDVEQVIVAKLSRAFESCDIPAIVALLSEDVRLNMPPLPLEYRGREAVAAFLDAIMRRGTRRYRLRSLRANGQPAFVVYMAEPAESVFVAQGLLALTLAGNQISMLTRFETRVLARFGVDASVPLHG